MRLSLVTAAIAGLTTCWCLFVLASADTPGHFLIDLQSAKIDARKAFGQYLQHFGRSYDHNKELFERKLSVWTDNLEQVIAGHNNEARLNGLADMSNEEFQQAYLGQRTRSRELTGTKHDQPYRYRYVQPLPEVDWRQAGIVGPIKNQHVNGSKCGCCWAFATIGVVECINAIVTGEVVSLSEQQLLDCDHAGPYHDEGCSGGDFDGGMQYIIDNGGIDTEENYPYKAEDGKCDTSKERVGVVTIDAVENVPPRNETALMQGVSMHPVGVAVCVGPYIEQWRAYTGGILHLPTNCDDPLDHAMVAVGYGVDKETDEPFWLLKNGWGDQWGEAGYLRVPKGLPGTGTIGLLSQPGYPIKISPNPDAAPESSQDWTAAMNRRSALLS